MPLRRRPPTQDWADVATATFTKPRGTGRHPRTLDRLRTLLARRRLRELIAVLAALLLLAGFLAGCAFKLTERPGDERSLTAWWEAGFVGVATGNTPDREPGGDSGGREVANAVVAFAGVLVPALFLGAIVFRLLVVPEVFVFRNRIALVDDAERGPHLAVRMYSGTRLRLIDVRCAMELHVETRDEKGEVIRACYHAIEVEDRDWPLAHQHIPFTVRVHLKPEDLGADGGLTGIQGHPVTRGDFLMVTMIARVPEVGSEAAEAHVFRIPDDVTRTAPGSVQTQPGRITKAPGWEGFDEPV